MIPQEQFDIKKRWTNPKWCIFFDSLTADLRCIDKNVATRFYVPIQLVFDMVQAAKAKGYATNAEYIKQTVREKLVHDQKETVTLSLKQKQARGI